MLRRLSANLRPWHLAWQWDLAAMIMPVGAGGHLERYANMEESRVNFRRREPWWGWWVPNENDKNRLDLEDNKNDTWMLYIKCNSSELHTLSTVFSWFAHGSTLTGRLCMSFCVLLWFMASWLILPSGWLPLLRYIQIYNACVVFLCVCIV